MKKGEQISSQILFFKKQSHIISNNKDKDENYFSKNNCFDLDKQTKEMHRSHFQSQANSYKNIDQNIFFDKLENSQMLSEGKDKNYEEEHFQKKDDNNLLNVPNLNSRQPFDSFYQSQQLSSQHQNSQTKSLKKFYPGQLNFSEKNLLKSANGKQKDDKFLVINSKKQKHNSNYLHLNDVTALKEEIKKYEISIEKLKQENLKLRSEKIKASSSSETMQLIEVRLQLEALKKRIKIYESQKQINLIVDQSIKKQDNRENMSVSLLQPVTYQKLEQSPKRKNMATFRKVQDKKNTISNQPQNPYQEQIHTTISPRNKPTVTIQFKNNGETNGNQNYRLLQNMKSPYFLKKI